MPDQSKLLCGRVANPPSRCATPKGELCYQFRVFEDSKRVAGLTRYVNVLLLFDPKKVWTEGPKEGDAVVLQGRYREKLSRRGTTERYLVSIIDEAQLANVTEAPASQEGPCPA